MSGEVSRCVRDIRYICNCQSVSLILKVLAAIVEQLVQLLDVRHARTACQVVLLLESRRI